MKVTGSAVLHAEPERVWAALHDPAVLTRVIPGCDGLIPLGDNHFGLTVTLGVASIKGSYSGEVRLEDIAAPSALVMRASGAGGPGTIDTTVRVDLADGGDGTTTLGYDADAIVGGMVGGVGQRVLVSVARRTAGLLFAAIDGVLVADAEAPLDEPGPAPAEPDRPTAPGPAELARPADGTGPAEHARGVAPEPVHRAQPVPARAGGTGATVLALAGAALFGAASVAVGVLIGARIGRPTRSPS